MIGGDIFSGRVCNKNINRGGMRIMLKTDSRAANKWGPHPKHVAVRVANRGGGTCTGVKYPCTYSCKKCYFEVIYH